MNTKEFRNVPCQEEVVRMELSDRLKSIIKELILTEEILNNAYCGVTSARMDAIKVQQEPSCHLEAIDAIEVLLANVHFIAIRISDELR